MIYPQFSALLIPSVQMRSWQIACSSLEGHSRKLGCGKSEVQKRESSDVIGGPSPELAHHQQRIPVPAGDCAEALLQHAVCLQLLSAHLPRGKGRPIGPFSCSGPLLCTIPV